MSLFGHVPLHDRQPPSPHELHQAERDAPGQAVHASRWNMSAAQPIAILAMGLLMALLLAAPGRTVTTKYLNDLFIFLDGGHQLAFGQVPNVDFHSSLGPLTYVIAWAGHALGGSWAAAMPVGMAIVTLLLAIVACHSVASRMRPVIGLPIAAFLLLATAAPINTGEDISELSFAMFYNRIGWSALGLLLILYLPPFVPTRRQTVLDGACAAVLILLMIYLKMTYALVMGAFVLLMLVDRNRDRWPAVCLGLVAITAIVVELLWGGSGAYVADLRSAASVSGDAPSIRRLLGTIQNNLADIIVFLIFSSVLLMARRRLRDLLFLGFCATTGVLIIDQNFQLVGILSLAAGAAGAAELLSRQSWASTSRWAQAARGAPLLLAAFILPSAAQNAGALGIHTTLAAARQGEPIALPAYEDITIARLWRDGATPRFLRYNDTIRDGADALRGLGPVGRVIVLDFVNPFTAGMDLRPASGDSPWFHWGRTINDGEYPQAESLFANAEIVMLPGQPIERFTGQGMRRLYEPYLKEHFRVVAQTRFWTIYRALP